MAERESEPGLGPFDKLVHEPARMGILTVLSRVKSAEFLFLQSTLGLSKGNLSSHLGKLEAAGLVHVGKRFEGKKPVTTLQITPMGRAAIDRHWQQLEALRQLG
ncbi:MAG: winged helix-turn-helix domain-containing protein [Propionibacteriaceae bacterium]